MPHSNATDEIFYTRMGMDRGRLSEIVGEAQKIQFQTVHVVALAYLFDQCHVMVADFWPPIIQCRVP